MEYPGLKQQQIGEISKLPGISQSVVTRATYRDEAIAAENNLRLIGTLNT